MSTASDSGESSIDGPLDVQKDDGWQDVEPDTEISNIFCLLCPTQNDDVSSFLSHCRQTHDFDLVHVVNVLDLDFIGTVKLVNYLRVHPLPDALKNDSIAECIEFQDDKFLKPALQDDALLYSLDEIMEMKTNGGEKESSKTPGPDTAGQVGELQEQLDQLKADFATYKAQTDQSFHENLAEVEARIPNTKNHRDAMETSSSGRRSHSAQLSGLKQYEDDYFNSYSYNTIHEIMLKDTVRTDAYRDFIYDNKNHFTNKTVLDIGCGTGILSMFAARAGAKLVVAVDNSSIIDKARQNIIENELQGTVTCIRGKIEEVQLPINQVDIIISEWMGYCLLYEAMLDSVLWARDHYLAPDGLMVPSSASLRITPFADEGLIAEHVDFWKDVYGFQMTSMLKTAIDDVLIRTMSPEGKIIGSDATFLDLDLHTCSTADLTFSSAGFASTITLPDSLPLALFTGFLVFFDIFFSQSRSDQSKTSSTIEEAKRKGNIAFTTGPDGPPTHWEQGLLLFKELREVKAGKVIFGTVGYDKRDGEARGLDIKVKFKIGDSKVVLQQDENKTGETSLYDGLRELEQVWSL
ncbi:MAG: hypothetical protein Q9160_003246 [Pyrenula sp. 1 TL-2023]